MKNPFPLACVALMVLLVVPASSVMASNHFIDVNEVYSNADGSVQYVELITTGVGQAFLGKTILKSFNADGSVEETVFDFIATYPPFQGLGTVGLTLLVATAGFEAEFGFDPDFVAQGQLFSPDGRILYQLETTGLEIDAVAHGNYTGPNGIFGSPAPALPTDGCMSLTRINGSNNNSIAWDILPPTPTRTDGTTGTAISCGPLEDFIRGDSNGDGTFNALIDAVHLLTFGFSGGGAPPCMESADVDGSGSVNALVDGTYALLHGFSGGAPPPPPYPTCGPDPDESGSLTCDVNGCP